MDTENSTQGKPALILTQTISGSSWWSRWKRRIGLFLGSIVLLLTAYIVGRRRHQGEEELSTATRDLTDAKKRNESVQAAVESLAAERVRILRDAAGDGLDQGPTTDDQIRERLRRGGVIK